MRDECTVFEAPKELKKAVRKAEEGLNKIMGGCRRVDKKPFQLKSEEIKLLKQLHGRRSYRA